MIIVDHKTPTTKTVDDYHKNVDPNYNRDIDRNTSFEKISLVFDLINKSCNHRERYLIVLNLVHRYMMVHVKKNNYEAFLKDINRFIMDYIKKEASNETDND